MKLSEEDINKYLKLLSSEYEKIVKLPISNMIQYKISNNNSVDFSRRAFKEENEFIVEVKDIVSFLKNPKEKMFLVAEINNCFFSDEYIYLDLVAGKNKVSIFLDKKILSTLNQKEINSIKIISNKKRKFIVALYIEKLSLKKMNGINISLKSKKRINIHEIK